MNLKRYKMVMLITAVATALLMAWCGMAAAFAGPVLMAYAVDMRSSTSILMVVILILSSIITYHISRSVPCPIPLLVMSMVLGVGYTVMDAWLMNLTTAHMMNMLIHRAIQATGLILPALATITAFFSLPTIFVKDAARRRGQPLLNLFTLLALIVTADAAMSLLGLRSSSWGQLVSSFSLISMSRYRTMLHAFMRAYTGVPSWISLIAGGLCLLTLGRAQYVAGLRMFRPGAIAQSPRPAAPPQARPIHPVQPRFQPCPQPHSQPRSAGMNSQDAAMLDAIAAQTISGTPVALNTLTGMPCVSERRR